MFGLTPSELKKIPPKDLEQEILRTGMIAELDAINLYEQMAATSTDPAVIKVLQDVAKEEKTHFGEFQILLLTQDEEQADELKAANEEVRKLLAELETRLG